MKTTALNNGIKVAAGSFLLYGFLVAALIFVKNVTKFSSNELFNVPNSINTKMHTASIINDNDTSLVLRLEMSYNKKFLLVSFNGDEGIDGKIKVYNQSNKLMITSSFELIKYPYYATVDITSLTSGSYDVTLITQSGMHSGNFKID